MIFVKFVHTLGLGAQRAARGDQLSRVRGLLGLNSLAHGLPAMRRALAASSRAGEPPMSLETRMNKVEALFIH